MAYAPRQYQAQQPPPPQQQQQQQRQYGYDDRGRQPGPPQQQPGGYGNQAQYQQQAPPPQQRPPPQQQHSMPYNNGAPYQQQAQSAPYSQPPQSQRQPQQRPPPQSRPLHQQQQQPPPQQQYQQNPPPQQRQPPPQQRQPPPQQQQYQEPQGGHGGYNDGGRGYGQQQQPTQQQHYDQQSGYGAPQGQDGYGYGNDQYHDQGYDQNAQQGYNDHGHGGYQQGGHQYDDQYAQQSQPMPPQQHHPGGHHDGHGNGRGNGHGPGQSQGEHRSRHHDQPREEKKKPAKPQRILETRPASPEVMSWDNPFPTFPAFQKKKEEKKDHKEHKDGHAHGHDSGGLEKSMSDMRINDHGAPSVKGQQSRPGTSQGHNVPEKRPGMRDRNHSTPGQRPNFDQAGTPNVPGTPSNGQGYGGNGGMPEHRSPNPNGNGGDYFPNQQRPPRGPGEARGNMPPPMNRNNSSQPPDNYGQQMPPMNRNNSGQPPNAYDQSMPPPVSRNNSSQPPDGYSGGHRPPQDQYGQPPQQSMGPPSPNPQTGRPQPATRPVRKDSAPSPAQRLPPIQTSHSFGFPENGVQSADGYSRSNTMPSNVAPPSAPGGQKSWKDLASPGLPPARGGTPNFSTPRPSTAGGNYRSQTPQMMSPTGETAPGFGKVGSPPAANPYAPPKTGLPSQPGPNRAPKLDMPNFDSRPTNPNMPTAFTPNIINAPPPTVAAAVEGELHMPNATPASPPQPQNGYGAPAYQSRSQQVAHRAQGQPPINEFDFGPGDAPVPQMSMPNPNQRVPGGPSPVNQGYAPSPVNANGNLPPRGASRAAAYDMQNGYGSPQSASGGARPSLDQVRPMNQGYGSPAPGAGRPSLDQGRPPMNGYGAPNGGPSPSNGFPPNGGGPSPGAGRGAPFSPPQQGYRGSPGGAPPPGTGGRPRPPVGGGPPGGIPGQAPGPGYPNGRSETPGGMPSGPVPVRPGLMQGGEGGGGPPPVRQYDQTPMHQISSGAPNQQASSLPPRKEVKKAEGPVTQEELRRLQETVSRNPQDNAAQFKLAKRMVEASTVLADEGGRADPKTRNRNRERYILDAHKIVKKLVQAGYADAMFYLADCHGQGLLGLVPDPKEAFNLYQAAAKLGHGPSAYRTAVCCELGHEEGGGTRRDAMKAIQWYRRAATLGDTPGMYKLGMILLKGLLGQPRNPKEAITWLKRAADNADAENPHALHELGLLYESGADGAVIRDEGYAAQLFTEAANLGYKFSQYRLGVIWEKGLLGYGVDARQSITWFSKAAAQGEHQSELALSGWYLTGSEGILQQSDTEAYLWARKAAQAGLARAEYAMGYFTEVGIGVPANIEDAKRWYWKAASQNMPKARERLEEIKRGGASKQKTRVSRSAMQRGEGGDGDCVVM